MRSLIITHSMHQDQEVMYPYYRLRETGTAPVVFAEHVGKVRGILGTEVEANLDFDSLNGNAIDGKVFQSFDLLVLPGGVKAMEKLRQISVVLNFIQEWFANDQPVACMCSGVQLLISASVVRGRRLTCYPAFAVDARNAGAKYVEEPIVVDDNLVTAPHYKWLGEWMGAAIRVARGARGEQLP